MRIKNVIDKIHTIGTIECEQPRTDLYTFNGRIELNALHRRQRMSLSEDVQHALPLNAENLLLRGSRIKNTEWAIGCAVYTGKNISFTRHKYKYNNNKNIQITYVIISNCFLGQNTKLSLNSRLTRNKLSSSEKYVNKFLVFFLLLLISWVTISYFIKRYIKHNHHIFEYVFYTF